MTSPTPQGASYPVAELIRQARTAPDRIAYIEATRSWTPRELLAEVEATAAGLIGNGVETGDRVALHAHTSVAAAVAYLACFAIGAIAVPLNARLSANELSGLAAQAGASTYLGSPDLHDIFDAVPPSVILTNRRFVAGGAGRPDEGLWPALRGDGPLVPVPVHTHQTAALLSTSGTTGPSKLAIYTHGTLAATPLTAEARGMGRHDTLPILTPITHSAGLFFALGALTQGATAVMLPRFEAGAVLDAIEAHRCTTVFGMPFMHAALVREQRAQPRDLSSLRLATVAGDVCPPNVERAVTEVFGVPLRSWWGSTEDGGATGPTEQPGPFTRMIPEATTRILVSGGDPVPDGEIGELAVRSPATSPGYWESDGTVTPHPDGFYRSGDLFRRSGDVLEFVGRAKDVIVRGGSNISPAEVEHAIMTNLGIDDVAVVGVPDPELGQRVAALIVAPGRELTLAALQAGLGAYLAQYKLPEMIAYATALPRNEMTKIDRAAVRRVVEEQHGHHH